MKKGSKMTPEQRERLRQAHLRPKRHYVCPQCGDAFTGGPGRKFCSRLCSALSRKTSLISKKAKRREYNLAHRKEHAAWMRQWLRKNISKVSNADLELYRGDGNRDHSFTAVCAMGKDAGKVFDAGGYVVCRECGAIRTRLTSGDTSHLLLHNMNRKQYAAKWGGGAPLFSIAVSKRQARVWQRTVRQWAGAAKPGRRADDQTGALLDELANKGLRWNLIKEQADKAIGVYRTIDAYQELLKRYRRRKKPTN